MYKYIILSILAYLFFSSCTEAQRELKTPFKSNPTNSIFIIEEGPEKNSAITIFRDSALYKNAFDVYELDFILTRGDYRTINLSSGAFDSLANYIQYSDIHVNFPYWDTTQPIPQVSSFEIGINDIKLLDKKYRKKVLFKGYTFFPDETIKYYTDLKSFLSKSNYQLQYNTLISAIDSIVLGGNGG